jgi:uncharacterized RDD family membrane protein YckC
VGFPRRLLALLYDAIAVLTLLYFAAFIPVLASGGALAPGNPLFLLYLALVAYGYFGACWTRGRTLGMQAWKLRIVATDTGLPPTWRRALLRFVAAMGAAAPCGLGYLAALWDPAGRAWHDRWSRTQLHPLNSSGGA